MSASEQPAMGKIAWADLTVPDAVAVRDFYAAVAGWTSSGVDMGGYEDFAMQGADGATAAGICHARGPNAGLPAQWLLYITVPDLDASLAACAARGGSVISGPRDAGGGARFAIIRDPAGAAAALFQPGASTPAA
jgi:predicted enzyme related to lactoylglutathione lyase